MMCARVTSRHWELLIRVWSQKVEQLALQLSVPSVDECLLRRSPLLDSTGAVFLAGFAEATCLEAEPVRGHERIIGDLVDKPHGGFVHYCTTAAEVCKASWPGRRVYHYDIWRPITISDVGSPSAKRGLRTVATSLSSRQPHRRTFLMKTTSYPVLVQDPVPERPRNCSRSLRISRPC